MLRLKVACRWIIGIGDEDNARAFIDRIQHGLEVMAEIACWHLDARAPTACVTRGKRRSMLRVDRRRAGNQKSARRELQQIIRTLPSTICSRATP